MCTIGQICNRCTGFVAVTTYTYVSLYTANKYSVERDEMSASACSRSCAWLEFVCVTDIHLFNNHFHMNVGVSSSAFYLPVHLLMTLFFNNILPCLSRMFLQSYSFYLHHSVTSDIGSHREHLLTCLKHLIQSLSYLHSACPNHLYSFVLITQLTDFHFLRFFSFLKNLSCVYVFSVCHNGDSLWCQMCCSRGSAASDVNEAGEQSNELKQLNPDKLKRYLYLTITNCV